MERFTQTIRTAEELKSIIGFPTELVIKKQLTELDHHMRAFIARSPFVLLGTVGKDGTCDVSPRGDSRNAATVLDAHTIVIPERPGNRRADSLRNILETGQVGLLFLVPGVGETLRINGRACLTTDQPMLAQMTKGDKPPVVGIGVEVEECYFHCAKALIRSMLWNQERAAVEFDLASVLIDQVRIEGEAAEQLRQRLEASYLHRLY